MYPSIISVSLSAKVAVTFAGLNAPERRAVGSGDCCVPGLTNTALSKLTAELLVAEVQPHGTFWALGTRFL